MMWILLRSPKMNWDIFGFQKRVWCPKCTPASSIRRIDTSAMELLLRVGPPRSPADDPVSRAPGQRFNGACVVLSLEASLPLRRALYTIAPLQQQRRSAPPESNSARQGLLSRFG